MTNIITSPAHAIAQALSDIEPFSRHILRRPLRPYQIEPIRAIIQSVIKHDGETYIMRFPRQSGKNEALAHLDAYLLFTFQRVKGASIVHAAPTFEPQAHNAILRVLEITAGNTFFRKLQHSGNTLTLGHCRSIYLSGAERDHPNVGLTASLLLKLDEAQDLNEDYCARTFLPMTASTNAPAVLTGTARHTGTYLARARIAQEQRQTQDRHKRVFICNWRDVAAISEPYRQHVQTQIALLGPQHPIIQNEYENIETEQTGRLFDDRRLALITAHANPRQHAPRDGEIYAATIDVGGADIADANTNKHDFTVCAIHRLTLTPDNLNAFQTIDYWAHSGANILDDTHDRRKLFAFLDLWQPAAIVTDTTGLGIGLASPLIKRYRTPGRDRVIPFTFTKQSKTTLLNNFLMLIETGRYHHFKTTDNHIDIDAERFLAQTAACEHTQLTTHTAWGIPTHATWRNPITLQDELLHDDHLIACAMVAVLHNANLKPRIATSTQAPRRHSHDPDDPDPNK